jgi:ribosomal protein S18 acetylase RimI-like enzyme
MSAEDLKEDLALRGSDYFRSRLAEDVILVAASSSALIGFAQFGSNKQWGSQLKKLYISSACHRRGVGKALMQHVIQALSGADTIMLTVYEENKSALALYTRFGFVVIGKVDVVVAGRVVGEDLVMIRPGRCPVTFKVCSIQGNTVVTHQVRLLSVKPKRGIVASLVWA